MVDEMHRVTCVDVFLRTLQDCKIAGMVIQSAQDVKSLTIQLCDAHPDEGDGRSSL